MPSPPEMEAHAIGNLLATIHKVVYPAPLLSSPLRTHVLSLAFSLVWTLLDTLLLRSKYSVPSSS